MKRYDWKDITSYSQGDKERIPSVFEYKTDETRIILVWNHRYYPYTWLVTCYDCRIEEKDLHLNSYDKIDFAKEMALESVCNKLKQMLDSLYL